MCTRPAARRARLIIGMELTIGNCVLGLHVSKEFLTPELGEELACERKEGHLNNIYTVAVKNDVTKTVQIKHNNVLYM